MKTTALKKMRVFIEYLDKPGEEHDLFENTDPIKIEKRYLSYALEHSERKPCRLIIQSNQPEVPAASLSLQAYDIKNSHMYERELVPERRYPIWCSPEATIQLTNGPWTPPTHHQVRALRELMTDPEGNELSVQQLATRMSYTRRTFYNHFKGGFGSSSGVPYLFWEKLLRMKGFPILESTNVPIPVEDLKKDAKVVRT